jgi:hypothetical protein
MAAIMLRTALGLRPKEDSVEHAGPPGELHPHTATSDDP